MRRPRVKRKDWPLFSDSGICLDDIMCEPVYELSDRRH